MINIIWKGIYKILEIFVFILGFILSHLFFLFVLFTAWSLWVVYVRHGFTAALLLGWVFLFIYIVILVNKIKSYNNDSSKELIEEITLSRKNGDTNETIVMKKYVDDEGEAKESNTHTNKKKRDSYANMWEDLDKQHWEYEEMNRHDK